MKSMYDMDTVQIEITDACVHQCANCTRFVGHRRPFYMTYECFKKAIDTMVDYPKMTGIMGGEPLVHPEFEKFCDYASSKISRKQLGLWTTFPKGFECYNEVICRTFGNIFLNDHTRGDVYHHPFLVAIEEVIPDRNRMFVEINKCYFQEAWSASINPKGAYFCEIAAALSLLFDGSDGWKVESGWWWRTPKDFKEQIEEFCPKCSGALCLHRRVSSPDGGHDDISLGNFERLKNTSYKIKENKCSIHDLKTIPFNEMEPLASYKDMSYRDQIASRYGIFLTINDDNFNEPHLLKEMNNEEALLQRYKKKYSG